MVPMRSVPHRVVCLLGLDDGVFPRLGLVDGDDVLARDPVTGERDIRSEDRQLLLDAIGAATETLVVTYTGANEHTGQPPAARRTPRRAARRPRPHHDPDRCASRIVVEHPLQPFDVRNVEPGRLGVPTPFTFDPTLLAAAETAAGDRGPPRRRSSTDPLAADRPIGRRRPRRPGRLLPATRSRGSSGRSTLTLPWDVDGVSDAMPVEIDQLETWGVGDRMLADMLRGIHPDQALRDRVAARGAAARPARLAQGQRGPRDRR